MSSPKYRYELLSSTSEEIRLVHLLPASNSSEHIRLRLVHVPFSRPYVSNPEQVRDARLFESLEKEFSFPWCLEETTCGELIAFNVVNGQTHLLDRDVLGLATSNGTYGSHVFEPEYEALSYTWGEAGISEFATIEVGDGVDRQLGIRQNLASALRHLRLQSDTRVLWIDAICINQDDVEERNQQVKRMTDIYTLARRVVAWLGDEQEGSELALETLQHVGRQLRSTKSGRVIAAPDATERQLWRNDTPPHFTQDVWEAVMALVERPWFYRIWCWQEIKLGSQGAMLQCGRVTISWREFWLAILCLNNKDISTSRHFRERCRHIVFLQYEGESMVNLLDTARSKGCADPRDKIYGLLGITPLHFRSRLTVNYHRPPEQVYKEAFMAHLYATQRLDLLKHCNLASRGIGGPSWVPDWSRTEFAAPILSEQISAGISRAWFTYHDEKPESLDVVGTQYTTIKTVIPGVASKVEEETLLIVKDWYEHFPPLGDTAYEDTEIAFILTLCMDRTMERNPNSHFLSAHGWVSMLHAILGLDPEQPDDVLYQKREIANLIQKIRGRRFIVTESGHFGTAPGGTMVGDSVSLILGTYAPIILRPTTSPTAHEPESFQVVGECYIHCLSDAVGLLGPIPHPWRPVILGDALGRLRHWFLNDVTGRRTVDDPRLGALPYQGWDRAVYERTDEDPAVFERFMNVETGEMVNHDPRMSVEALEVRGVPLRTFSLV